MHPNDWLEWIMNDVRQEQREELFQLGFDWEVNNDPRGYRCLDVFIWHPEFGKEYVPDLSVNMIYGSDYFIERDLVH